ncbi:MAG: efflux RND transporter permease subunit [Deltaproteobacteria bacterium]|nr:efflux RND transporter permease subunit [Deltaproteobacteria bacterium]
MFLTRFGLSRPIIVRMALILIVVIGVYCYKAMPRYLDPDLTIGEGSIYTICPGFSPEEMEKLVTNKIEEELEGISEIRKLESESFESISKIHVFFNTNLSEYGIDQGMQEVRNAVDRVDDLPEDAEVPVVTEIDIALFPCCMVGLAGDLPMMQLQDIAEEIADTLENIKGVSEVEVIGKRDNEIWVELDPRRMSAYGISVSHVARAIADRSQNLPGGTIEMGDHETAIRMRGEPERPEDLGEIALKSVNGGIVCLRDIARIRPTLEKPITLTFINKKKALILGVKRKRNTNVIQIVDDAKELIKDIPAQYPGLKTTIYFDQSREIKKRIQELQTNAFIGVIFVFIILFISMGLRNAVYASIGIPVSFLLTFILMKCFNLSIDGVSLFGLILVLGVIVDDAIVVLENIFRHLEKGSPLFTATLEGSREVLAPVLASVSTTMAAFFPILILVGGMVGRFLEILPKVVIFALVASIFEVFFMLPSHVAELTPKDYIKKKLIRRFNIFTPIRKIYYPSLRAILRHRYRSVLVIVLSTLLACILYFQTDFVAFPKSDAFPRFNIYFDLPVGSTLERTKNVLMPLTDLIKGRIGPDLDAPITISGMKEVNYEPIFGKHYGIMNVILKGSKERIHSVVDLMEGVREDVEKLLYSKGATSVVLERMLEGPPVGALGDFSYNFPPYQRRACQA